MKKEINYLLKLILCFFLFFNISYIVAIIFSIVGIDYSNFNYQELTIMSILSELLLFIFILLLYKKEFRKDYIVFKLNYKDYIKKIFIYFIMFMALKIASSLISTILATILNYNLGDSENQETIIKFTTSAPLLMLFNTCILAPFVEEGIFRLSIKKVFKNKYFFILVSGLFFGLMHIFPTELPISLALIYAISYVTMGLYLAYIYTKENNIWVTIFVHALNNIISMIAILALI